MFAFLPGVDGLRMMQAYANYNDPQKLPVIDYGGGITSGPNVLDLKDKAVGIVGSRNASANGKRLATMLARDLAAAGLVVVSGFARQAIERLSS